MSEELLSLFQARIDTAYHEQVWAVAITGAAIGFLLSNLHPMTSALHPRFAGAAVILFAGIGTGFVWSRYFIFRHYDACIRDIVASGETTTRCCTRGGSALLRELAGLSGSLFYSGIIVLLCCLALGMVGKRQSGSNATDTNAPALDPPE